MVYAGAAWAAGLALASVPVSVTSALLTAVLSALIFKLIYRFELRKIILLISAFIFALGFYKTYDMLIYKRIISFSEKEIQYTGTVTNLKDFSEDRSIYYLKGKINGKINAGLIVNTSSIMCEPGDGISLKCTVKTPENQYLFNGLNYYKAKGFYLQTNSAESIDVTHRKYSLLKLLYKYRSKICGVIESNIPEREAQMIMGMLFGDKSGFDEYDANMLYRTGIGHVTAVSGLHLVLFCNLISFIVKKLNAGKIIQFAASEIFMTLFSLCCGMPVSVIRAFIMMTLVNIAPLIFRYTDSLNSICVSVIFLTLQNPFIIRDPSFLLSVSGALGAGAFAPHITSGIRTDKMLTKQLKNLAFFIFTSLTTAPASIICFGELSVISPISNILITPVCMAAILAAMTASLLIFIRPVFLFKISALLCKIVLNTSEIVGENKFTHTNFTGNYVPVIIFIFIIFCISTYLIFKDRKYTVLSVTISAAILFGSSSLYAVTDSRAIKIAMLGKSEPGVIVVSKGYAADVIDINGKQKNCLYAAKYLNSMGISKINSIVITHNQYPAMSSYNDAFSLFDVGNIIIPSGTHLRQDILICGSKPEYSDLNRLLMNYGSYRVSLINDAVYADYADFHFVYSCKKTQDKNYPANSVLYGADNGKYKLRRLEND